MLEVSGLGVSLNGTRVLDGIDLHVATGEVVALLGGPGAGKTVLARSLSGLVPAFAGRIGFLGQDMTGADHTAAVRAGLGHVPQDGLVFPNLPVRDNLLLGATLRGRARRQARLAEVLEMIPPLRDGMERLAGSLDRGTQQLVAIGRGLMACPRLLILDDPGAALPDLARAELAVLVDRLSRQGMSFLLMGRGLVPPLAVAGRACMLDSGRIVFDGPAGSLADQIPP